MAFLSRNFPEPDTEADRIEGRKHTKTFVARFPHLATMLSFEENPTVYQGRAAHKAFIPKHSRLVQTLEAFAARVGMALYRNHVGHPVPVGSSIHASWHPNAQLDDDETLNGLLQAMGAPRTIHQGHWEVADQFRYWAGTPAERPDLFCCFAAFRQSFGILAIIDPTAEEWQEEDWDPAYTPHRPGFLKGFKS